MAHLANLVRWEWFKLRRRWMPWILLAIVLLFSQLFLWSSFFGYRSLEASSGHIMTGGSDLPEPVMVDCEDALAGRMPEALRDAPPERVNQIRESCARNLAQAEVQLAASRARFTLPGSLPGSLNIAHNIGALLVAILTASVIGSEYGWGTMRTVLLRGTGRWPYLAGKLGLLGLLGGGALVAVTLATISSSLIAGALAGGGQEANPGQTWTDAAVAFGKTWYGLLPYVALAAAVTVVTRSSAAGIAISLAYNFGEQIAVVILINFFAWFENVADYLLGRNVTAWMLDESARAGGGLGFGGIIGEVPGQWHAFVVLLAYMAALGAAAFWVIERRDVAGSSGG